MPPDQRFNMQQQQQGMPPLHMNPGGMPPRMAMNQFELMNQQQQHSQQQYNHQNGLSLPPMNNNFPSLTSNDMNILDNNNSYNNNNNNHVLPQMLQSNDIGSNDILNNPLVGFGDLHDQLLFNDQI